MTTAVDRLRTILFDLDAPALIAAYYETLSDGGPAFSGSWFERLGGGGDRQETKDVFTAEDLIAVSMLSVKVPPRVAGWMLEETWPGSGRLELSKLLGEVPVDLTPESREGREQLRDKSSPLNRLWHSLKDQDQIGFVRAGKLCARKRPALAPVYDDVVRQAVGRPPNWWDTVAEAFEDSEIVERLGELRDLVDFVIAPTLLRTLDIAVWMRQHGAQSAQDSSLRALRPVTFAATN